MGQLQIRHHGKRLHKDLRHSPNHALPPDWTKKRTIVNHRHSSKSTAGLSLSLSVDNFPLSNLNPGRAPSFCHVETEIYLPTFIVLVDLHNPPSSRGMKTRLGGRSGRIVDTKTTYLFSFEQKKEHSRCNRREHGHWTNHLSLHKHDNNCTVARLQLTSQVKRKPSLPKPRNQGKSTCHMTSARPRDKQKTLFFLSSRQALSFQELGFWLSVSLLLKHCFFTFYPFSIVWSLFLGLGPACIRPLGTKYASDIEFWLRSAQPGPAAQNRARGVSAGYSVGRKKKYFEKNHSDGSWFSALIILHTTKVQPD